MVVQSNTLYHDYYGVTIAMVSTVAIDGVPKSELPPRRMLWDILKPQAAQVTYSSLCNDCDMPSLLL